MVYIHKDNLIKWLKENLDSERFEHSLGVAEKSIELAQKFNLNIEKAEIAGLLHDCAKCLSKEELINIITNFINVEQCEMINPKTFHAPAGVYIAQKEFNIQDEEILSAIRWHTIGHRNMTDFEKIIFLADKIEGRTRPKEMIEFISQYIDKTNGLNKALLACYKLTIKSLVDRDLKICTNTIDLYNELLGTIND